MIASPNLEDEFVFIETIGLGSQASVDLFLSKPGSCGEQPQKYAVKRYTLSSNEYESNMDLI